MLEHYIEVDGQSTFAVENIPVQAVSAPTVIIVSGLGTTCTGWRAVQRLLPRHIRSFSYDRLGLGKSDRATSPRTASNLAIELKKTLLTGRIPAPYLLVAHSYAGIICREFLEKYNEDVAGLVCVDANQENTQVERDWPFVASSRIIESAWTTDDSSGLSTSYRCTDEEWSRMVEEEARQREKRAREAELPAPSIPGEGASYLSSLEMLGTYKQFERRALGHRPLSVIMANLTRDVQRFASAGKERGRGTLQDHAEIELLCSRLPSIELRLCAQMLQLSSLHRLIITSVSGHLVNLWEPELVTQEIEWCLGHISDSV